MTQTHDAGDGGRSDRRRRCSTRRSAPTWRRTVAAHGAARRSSRATRDVRWTYDELAERVERLAPGLLGLGLEVGDRVGLWSPNYAEWTLLQYATAEIGVILVNINPAYRTHELAYVLDQSGCRMLIAAPTFKTSDYVEMVDAGRAPSCPALERSIFFWDDEWDELVAGERRRHRRRLWRRGGRRCGRTTRSTSSTRRARPGSRRAPRSRTATSSTTATSWPALQGFTAGRPAVHPGALLPLLRHGHGQPRLHHARRDDGDPGRRLRPGARARDGRGRALHRALRRADDVHRRARPPRLRALRPVVAAHRRDGRLAVPGRGDEGVHRPHAHGRGDHLLRHDRDVAGVDADAARRLARTTAPRPSAGPIPHVEIRIADPATGDDPRARRDRRVLHPRLLGDARLLERPGAHRRGHRRRRVDAHRRPRR